MLRLSIRHARCETLWWSQRQLRYASRLTLLPFHRSTPHRVRHLVGRRCHRQHPDVQLAQLIALFGMFAAGGFLGWGLSAWAAPGSGLGAAISGLLLPSSFAAGLVIWSGLEIVTVVLDRIRG